MSYWPRILTALIVVFVIAATHSLETNEVVRNTEAKIADRNHTLSRENNSFSQNPLSSHTPNSSSVAQTVTQVRAMNLISDDFAWVLTDKELMSTNRSGKSWQTITPPNVPASSINTVFFLDASHGWALITDDSSIVPGAFSLASTSDAGKTWVRKTVSLSGDVAESFSGTAYMDFVDPLHGWIMLRLTSSANFSRGALLTTGDGGNSWSALPDPPLGSPIQFVSSERGWIAGGPNGDQLYWTDDSGRHWKRTSVDSPPGINPSLKVNYDVPTFDDQLRGILPVTFSGNEGIYRVFFRTEDGGRSWTAAITSAWADAETDLAVAVVNSRTVIVIPSNKKEIEIFAEGKRVRRSLGKSTAIDAPFTRVDFLNKDNGWLLLTIGKCRGFKTDCTQETRLFTTEDGAQTLHDITPMVTTSSPVGGKVMLRDDWDTAAATTTTLQNKEGFDRCAVASTAQMQTWWTASPYRAAGVYIGGENHSCKTQSISAAWISTVLNMGWGIIPTWVGPQAPSVSGTCQTTCSKMSTNSATAESQGVAEANKAADQATAYGLSSTIIYYDMEAYDSSVSGTVVKAFMNGWVRRLQERGFNAGGYSSRLNVSDWANIPNPPTAIWFTWFFQNGVPCGDECHTVFDVPGISNSLWVNHQRLRQTSSGFNRCWSSTCLTIDEDWLDGPVAGGTTSCSFTVGQGTSGSEANSFQNAFNVIGGQSVLGCATAAVRFDGFTSFAGTIGHFQNFANGEIEYLVNGSRAGQAYALTAPFADKWELLGFTSNNPLGYPIGNRTFGSAPSCASTNHEFQSFEGGSLTRHTSGSRSGSVYEVHGAIHSKWSSKGFAGCPLGLPISDERNASPSGATGKTGRVNDFERGHIYWWTNAAEAFETHGAIDSLYTSMGATASWLGFPVSDEYIAQTGRPRSDFEGGFITTSDGITFTAISNTTRILTVMSSNPNSGVSITVTPNDNNNAGSGTTQFTRTYNNNTSVTLTAPLTVGGNAFQKWQLAGSDWSTSRTTTISMSANRTMTAVYVNSISPPTANPATNVSTSGFTANWSSSANATGYRLDVSTSDSFASFVSGFQNLDVGNVLSRNVTGLTQGTTYFYRVRAYNSGGTSGNSGTINVTTGVNPPTAPTANPATNVGTTSFTANWGAATGAAGYRLDVSTNNSFSTFVSGFQNLDVGNSLSRNVTGLSPGTTYFYRVRAYNSAGTSNNSGAITVTTSTQSFTITVAASPSTAGNVTGGGTFAAGSTRTVIATANSGHTFANWTENGNVVSTAASYSFILNANRNLIANFVTTPVSGNASYDAFLKVPKCGQAGALCDSGALLNGRDSISGGQEPNQPNTINSSCPDNTAGSYHVDESVDRIRISTLDGSSFAPGKTVRIEVSVWAFAATQDFLDLFYAPDANNPNWIYITTLVPAAAGAQVLTTTFTLANGSGLQAVRANFLFQGSPTACSGGEGNFDDHDDLAFAVQNDPGSWQPHVLTSTAVTTNSWTINGRTFLYVKLNFPDVGFRVSNWGSPVRIGNDVSVDALVERFNGVSTQALSSTAQIYDLGFVPEGAYTFTFKNSGTTVKVSNFAVTLQPPPANPIDGIAGAREFVRWQYKDFLRREPDGPGWDHWTAEITMCTDPTRRFPGETESACIQRKRANTSAAFFFSPEFQNTGYFVIRVYRGSLGRMPYFGGGLASDSEFTRDATTVAAGIVVNDALAPNVINANKQAFVSEFVTRSEFRAIYDSLNNTQFVDKLFQTTGVTPTSSERQSLIDGLNNGSETRTSVLFKVVDGTTTVNGGLLVFNTSYGKAFYDNLFNAAFVRMEYFGYLMRDPDPDGYNFWLDKLNHVGNWVDAQMVLAFITSPEYRARFGAP